jgi:hypothetical protein
MVTRDAALFLLGAGIAIWEIRHPEVRDSVLAFAGTLLGAPIGAEVLASLAVAWRSRTGTGSSLPSSPEAQPPPSVSS